MAKSQASTLVAIVMLVAACGSNPPANISSTGDAAPVAHFLDQWPDLPAGPDYKGHATKVDADNGVVYIDNCALAREATDPGGPFDGQGYICPNEDDTTTTDAPAGGAAGPRTTTAAKRSGGSTGGPADPVVTTTTTTWAQAPTPAPDDPPETNDPDSEPTTTTQPPTTSTTAQHGMTGGPAG